MVDEANHVRREIYISSGLKNGFYTLRSHTSGGRCSTDIYLRNLSTDPEKAEAKAREYFERVYGWQPCADVVFLGYADFDLTAWGSALQPWERKQVEEVGAGFWPFGKYKGTRIEDAAEGYILFWAQQKVENGKPVAAALVEFCRSIADDRGLAMKFEERRREVEARKEAQRAISVHVGTPGKRDVFALTMQGSTRFEGDYGFVYLFFFDDAAGNAVVYKGSSNLGLTKGETYQIKATVKAHGERDGIKQTTISRPVVLSPSVAIAA